MKTDEIKLSKARYRGFLAVSAFFLMGLSLLALSQKIVRPQATCGKPEFSFISNPPSVVVGENFDLLINLDPKGCTNIIAFTLRFTFDDTKIELQNPSDVGSNILPTNPNFIYTGILNGNKIIIEGGLPNANLLTYQTMFTVKMRAKNIPITELTSAAVNWQNDTESGDYTSDKLNNVDILVNIIPAGAVNSPTPTPDSPPHTPTPSPTGMPFMGMQLGPTHEDQPFSIFQFILGLNLF